jgi:hypothetical protein
MYTSNATLIATTISLVGLIITLLKILDEQRKYHKFRYNQDKRIEYKLKIHQILVPNILDYEDIVSTLQEQNPTSLVDKLEIRKCLYEMLSEHTIIAFEDGTYSVDTAISYDSFDYENEEDDEDEDHLWSTP